MWSKSNIPVHDIHINAERTKQKQHRQYGETTDKYFFSKYCEDSNVKIYKITILHSEGNMVRWCLRTGAEDSVWI